MSNVSISVSGTAGRGAPGDHSRLRLRGIIPQGDTVALDLVEALLAEVIPVSDKAMSG